MAKKLTKGVFAGTQYTELLKLNWNGETYEIEIKPLSNKEATEVELLQQEGLNISLKQGLKGKMNRDISIDTKANYKGRKQADIKAVAYGTTDEDITEEVARDEFPPSFVKEIADRIRKISGMGNQKEMENLFDESENPSNSEGK